MRIGQLKPVKMQKIASIMCNVLKEVVNITGVFKVDTTGRKYIDSHNVNIATRFSLTTPSHHKHMPFIQTIF